MGQTGKVGHKGGRVVQMTGISNYPKTWPWASFLWEMVAMEAISL